MPILIITDVEPPLKPLWWEDGCVAARERFAASGLRRSSPLLGTYALIKKKWTKSVKSCKFVGLIFEIRGLSGHMILIVRQGRAEKSMWGNLVQLQCASGFVALQ
jgi:hypothetical protein